MKELTELSEMEAEENVFGKTLENTFSPKGSHDPTLEILDNIKKEMNVLSFF